MRLSQHYEVSFGTRSIRREHNHLFVLKDGFHPFLTLDYFVKRRIFDLVKCKFGLLNLRQGLPLLQLGSPLAHCKDRIRLAELRENQIAIFVKTLKFLTESASQGKRFDVDFKQKHFFACLHQLSEVGYVTNVLLQFLLGCGANALVCPMNTVTHPLT